MTSSATTPILTVIRIVFGIMGLLTVYVGIDNAFGGIATLGMQGPSNFFDVTDQKAFSVRDSHVKFLGGVWLGAGLLLAAGAVWPRVFRDALLAVCGLAFVGGLARLASGGVAVFSDTGLIVALAIELIVFPALGFALWWLVANANSK